MVAYFVTHWIGKNVVKTVRCALCCESVIEPMCFTVGNVMKLHPVLMGVPAIYKLHPSVVVRYHMPPVTQFNHTLAGLDH